MYLGLKDELMKRKFWIDIFLEVLWLSVVVPSLLVHSLLENTSQSREDARP